MKQWNEFQGFLLKCNFNEIYLQSIEYDDVHDPASKGIQGEGAVKFSIHIENDEDFEE